MNIQEISRTPLCMLTPADLLAYLTENGVFAGAQPSEPTAQPSACLIAQDRVYVRGIKGIMDLFQVSNVTAQRYKNGIIKDAVSQYGRNILVDVDRARELFATAKGTPEMRASE